jgi:hypothetical protein
MDRSASPLRSTSGVVGRTRNAASKFFRRPTVLAGRTTSPPPRAVLDRPVRSRWRRPILGGPGFGRAGLPLSAPTVVLAQSGRRPTGCIKKLGQRLGHPEPRRGGRPARSGPQGVGSANHPTKPRGECPCPPQGRLPPGSLRARPGDGLGGADGVRPAPTAVEESDGQDPVTSHVVDESLKPSGPGRPDADGRELRPSGSPVRTSRTGVTPGPADAAAGGWLLAAPSRRPASPLYFT